MPELAEVETIRRSLKKSMEKRTVKNIIIHRKDLRIPIPEDFIKNIENRKILSLGRKGKYLLVHLDNGFTVIAHFGMSGKMIARDKIPEKYNKHDHVVFITDENKAVVFNDPRRFGLVTFCRTDEIDSHKLFKNMGECPLSEKFDTDYLLEKFKSRKAPVKTVLLDQNTVAGLGNIYVCESLFMSEISPFTKANEITHKQADLLVEAIKEVLEKAIEAGGSTLKDYARPDGIKGLFQNAFQVYDREGKPCGKCTCDVCETGGVKRTIQAGRATFYCPCRQG